MARVWPNKQALIIKQEKFLLFIQYERVFWNSLRSFSLECSWIFFRHSFETREWYTSIVCVCGDHFHNNRPNKQAKCIVIEEHVNIVCSFVLHTHAVWLFFSDSQKKKKCFQTEKNRIGIHQGEESNGGKNRQIPPCHPTTTITNNIEYIMSYSHHQT